MGMSHKPMLRDAAWCWRKEADSLDGGGWYMSGTTLGAFRKFRAACLRFAATVADVLACR